MPANSIQTLPERLTLTTLIAVHVDICRAVTLFRQIDDGIKTVMFLDGFYSLCHDHLEPFEGEIIKYMGDSCLAVFPEYAALAAIEAVSSLRNAFPAYCRSHQVTPTDLRAGIHIDECIIGEFGKNAQRDVLGRGSSLAIHMAEPGITLSEQVYRKLPSANRSPFRKHGGQIRYHLQ
jgi:class 3 adenylate cyclase